MTDEMNIAKAEVSISLSVMETNFHKADTAVKVIAGTKDVEVMASRATGLSGTTAHKVRKQRK